MANGRIVVIQPRPNQKGTVGTPTGEPVLLGFFDVLLEGLSQFFLQAARKKGISDPALESFGRNGKPLTFDALVTQAVNIFQCEMQREQLKAILTRSGHKCRFWARFTELEDELQAIIPDFSCTRNCLEFVFDFIKDSGVSVGAIGLEVDWIRRQISEKVIPKFDQLVESAGIILGCDGEKQGSLEAILKEAARTPPSGWPILKAELQTLSDRSAMTSFPECAFDLTSSSDCTSLSAAPSGDLFPKMKLDGLAKWIRSLPAPAQNDLQNSWFSSQRDLEYSKIKDGFLRDPSSPDLMENIWKGIERLGWNLTLAYKEAVAKYLQQPDTELPNCNDGGLTCNRKVVINCMKEGRKFYENLFNSSDDLRASILDTPSVQQLGQSVIGLEPHVAKLHLWGCVSKVYSDAAKMTGEHPEFTRFATEFWQNRWVEDVHKVLLNLSKWLAKKHESCQSIDSECLIASHALLRKSQLDEDEKILCSVVQKLYALGMSFTTRGSQSLVQSLHRVRSSKSIPNVAGIFIKHALIRKYVHTCMASAMRLHYVDDPPKKPIHR